MKTPFILMVASLLAFTALALAGPAQPVFQLRLADDVPSDNSERMTYVTHYDQHIVTHVFFVQKTVLLDETALKSAKPGKDARGGEIIDVTFTDAGTKKFAEVTRQNIHKHLAIIIDGQLCQAPIIQTEISGGKAQISGNFSNQEAKDLAKKISEAAKKK
jgi:preprotein translocase subunit SecD